LSSMQSSLQKTIVKTHKDLLSKSRSFLFSHLQKLTILDILSHV
jgi:hypothetical protein